MQRYTKTARTLTKHIKHNNEILAIAEFRDCIEYPRLTQKTPLPLLSQLKKKLLQAYSTFTKSSFPLAPSFTSKAFCALAVLPSTISTGGAVTKYFFSKASFNKSSKTHASMRPHLGHRYQDEQPLPSKLPHIQGFHIFLTTEESR